MWFICLMILSKNILFTSELKILTLFHLMDAGLLMVERRGDLGSELSFLDMLSLERILSEIHICLMSLTLILRGITMNSNYFDAKKYCNLYPMGYVPCPYNEFQCFKCDIADRYRANTLNQDNVPLFNDTDVYPLTKKGCLNFVGKPLLLKPETMRRLELEEKLFYQIVIPELSPGLFNNNPVGFIDCKLFVNQKRSFVVYRNEVFGALLPSAIERYDKYFMLGLARFCKSLR